MPALMVKMGWSHLHQPARAVRVLIGEQNVAPETGFVGLDDLAAEGHGERPYPFGRLDGGGAFALSDDLARLLEGDVHQLSAARLGDVCHAQHRDVTLEPDPHIAVNIEVQVVGNIAAVVDRHKFQTPNFKLQNPQQPFEFDPLKFGSLEFGPLEFAPLEFGVALSLAARTRLQRARPPGAVDTLLGEEGLILFDAP